MKSPSSEQQRPTQTPVGSRTDSAGSLPRSTTGARAPRQIERWPSPTKLGAFLAIGVLALTVGDAAAQPTEADGPTEAEQQCASFLTAFGESETVTFDVVGTVQGYAFVEYGPAVPSDWGDAVIEVRYLDVEGNAWSSFQYFACDGSDMVLRAILGHPHRVNVFFEPPLPMLRFPVEVGSIWEWSGTMRHFRPDGWQEVEAVRSLVVTDVSEEGGTPVAVVRTDRSETIVYSLNLWALEPQPGLVGLEEHVPDTEQPSVAWVLPSVDTTTLLGMVEHQCDVLGVELPTSFSEEIVPLGGDHPGIVRYEVTLRIDAAPLGDLRSWIRGMSVFSPALVASIHLRPSQTRDGEYQLDATLAILQDDETSANLHDLLAAEMGFNGYSTCAADLSDAIRQLLAEIPSELTRLTVDLVADEFQVRGTGDGAVTVETLRRQLEFLDLVDAVELTSASFLPNSEIMAYRFDGGLACP